MNRKSTGESENDLSEMDEDTRPSSSTSRMGAGKASETDDDRRLREDLERLTRLPIAELTVVTDL